MVTISATWPDVADLLDTLEPEYARRVTSAVTAFRTLFLNIVTLATKHRSGNIHCIIADRYTWGQSFVVFEIIFDDGLSWIIRLGMRPMDEYYNSEAQLERKILNEVAALRLVRQRTSIPVPEVIAYHASRSPTNPLGPDAPPFVLMTALAGVNIADCGISLMGGDPLQGDESKRPILDNFLNDIVDIHVQLTRITFPTIGSFVLSGEDDEISIGPDADFGLGPFTSARQYFATHANAYDKLATASLSESEVERMKKQFVASLWRTAMMPLIDADDDNGPFPMGHGDLHCANILVDYTGHIVGVLDWDCAGTVPWEKVAVPSFELSGLFSDVGNGQTREERLVLHHAFSNALKRVEYAPTTPSGRTLSALHDSDAGQVGSYISYWMYLTDCSYEHSGRALHAMLSGGDIDKAFEDFAAKQSQQNLEEICP